MIWATNYTRLACQVIFTMMFGGKDFFPKCVIDGMNIQDYLQGHFVDACKYLAQGIHDAGGLHGENVIGYESVNEPNKGLISHPDLNIVPEEQKLKKGTTPTAFQAMLTGSGRAVEMPTWDFGGLGPYKSGTELVDPQGETAWLDPETWDDTKYGWKRAESWKLGEDIFAQHGIWDPSTDSLKKPLYFTKTPSGKEIDADFYINNYFMDYYRRYKDAVRSVWPDAIMLCQPCPFEIPPKIKGTKDDDPNMVFASHFYDGITLITKKWNRYWNVDVLGVLRGRYSSPAFALKIGENAVRNVFRDQLTEIRREGLEYMGEHPCMYTEIGIPYDMDNKAAYDTGNYFSQSLAIDANHYALESSQASGFTWWVYVASNSHAWGDNWNGEDLSIYSAEDKQLPTSPNNPTINPRPPPTEADNASDTATSSSVQVSPSNVKKTLSVDEMSTSHASASASENAGYRAAEAFVRPYPILTHGSILSYNFDLKSGVFHFTLKSPSPTPQDLPTEIFLPAFHFPAQQTSVEVSGGKWTISQTEVEGVEDAAQQVLKWWHGEGEQRMTVKGVKRQRGAGSTETRAEDEGYLEQYLQVGRQCAVM